nr:MAG TPA: hypothetical protein [Caudoviricetes sp.]
MLPAPHGSESTSRRPGRTEMIFRCTTNGYKTKHTAG